MCNSPQAVENSRDNYRSVSKSLHKSLWRFLSGYRKQIRTDRDQGRQTGSISSRQCLGGLSSAGFTAFIVTSAPQMLHL